MRSPHSAEDELRCCLGRRGACTCVLTDIERHAMFKLAEGARLLMEKRATDLLDSTIAHDDSPTLNCYMCYGLACDINEARSAKTYVSSSRVARRFRA